MPTAAISPWLIDAVNWPLFTKLVMRGESFQLTTEEDMKLLPLTVRVKPEPPAVTWSGDKLEIAGTALPGGGGGGGELWPPPLHAVRPKTNVETASAACHVFG